MKRSQTSDQELVLAVERAKGHNRWRTKKRDGWERELRAAYLLDGPGRLRVSSSLPADIAYPWNAPARPEPSGRRRGRNERRGAAATNT